MSTQRLGLETGGTGRLHTIDRQILDRWLAALETHDHAGGSNPHALADPAGTPTAVASSAGGMLADGQTLYYQVSYLDGYGLETAASDEVSVVLAGTASADEPPNPTGAAVDGATLPPDTYYYGLTVNTDAGESALGPLAIITLAVDQNAVDVELPALPDGASSFNIWRQAMGDVGYTKVATDVTDTFTDDGVPRGSCLTDPATQPPDGLTGLGTNTVTVTVPDTALVGAGDSAVKRWRLYRSDESGNYGDTALVAEVAVPAQDEPLPTEYADTGAPLLPGTPLSVSTTLRPSVSVAGGAAGPSCMVIPATAATIPAAGVSAPIRLATSDPPATEGADILFVGDAAGLDGDQFEVLSDGVYALGVMVQIDGAPGDVVHVSWFYPNGSPPVGVLSAGAQLTVPPGAATPVVGLLAGPAVFLAKGTRIALNAAVYYTSEPAALSFGAILTKVDGVTASDRISYAAPAGLTVDVGGPQLALGWDTRAQDDGYRVLIYPDAVPTGDPVTATVGAGVGAFTVNPGDLVSGTAYAVFVLAYKTIIDGTTVYSELATERAVLAP